MRLPLQLALILLLAIASAHASTLDDVNVYAGGNSTPSEWAIIVVLFDSAGTVTDVSTFTDITEIRVVVDRIMPSSVRKLRSLLPRSESIATLAASKNEACDFNFT